MTYAIQIIACIVLAFIGAAFAMGGGQYLAKGDRAETKTFMIMALFMIALAILVRPCP
jgi:FtsH-binding integral membrane protein